MVQVLSGVDKLEELYYSSGPIGDIASHLLQHGCRPFAAAVAERVSDEGAGAEGPSADRLQPTDAQEVADIRRHPFLARLDEPVLIKPGDVGVQSAKFGFEDGHEGAQRFALFAVTDTVDRGEQVVETAGRGTHGCISVKMIPAGLAIRSCAGRMLPPSLRAGKAQRMDWRSAEGAVTE